MRLLSYNLTLDRNPPLDLVVQSAVVIPRLIEFLSRHDSQQLQLEAAWSITNIACGEARHIKVLVINGAVLQLMLLVQATQHRKVRDQAMWAICNLTADAFACRSALLLPPFLSTILSLIGLNCYADPFTRIVQTPMTENPTLSIMRYVSFTCSNFVRLKDFPEEMSESQQHDVFRKVLFCMSEMFQSPVSYNTYD